MQFLPQLNMREINPEFLKDGKGRLSSKRLGFLKSLNHWIAMGWVTLIWLLVKKEYDLAINLVEASALVTFGFASVVASEWFSKNNSSKKDVA